MPREIGVPVQPIMVHLVCDCGGQLQFTGATRPGIDPKGPPHTLHKCAQCGVAEIVSGQPYPRTVFRPLQPSAPEPPVIAGKPPGNSGPS